MNAEEAKNFGLVHRVYPDAELREHTLATAKRFASGPAAAFRYAKANLNAAEDGTLESVFELEATHSTLAGMALLASLKRD